MNASFIEGNTKVIYTKFIYSLFTLWPYKIQQQKL